MMRRLRISGTIRLIWSLRLCRAKIPCQRSKKVKEAVAGAEEVLIKVYNL